MTDILDHLQPDSPLYEATREAAREEITRLRSLNKELAEALQPFAVYPFAFGLPTETRGIFVSVGQLQTARAALTKYRGKE